MRRRIVAQYIKFTDKDGSTFLVEIDEDEVLSPGGIAKAGLKEAAGETVEKAVVAAQTLFEHAVNNVIEHNAKAFLQAIRNLPQQDQPESLEVTFALKATGEIGNTAIAKGTGEANYTITLTWKRSTKDG
jgi:hypothetical protein